MTHMDPEPGVLRQPVGAGAPHVVRHGDGRLDSARAALIYQHKTTTDPAPVI
jgi:hypothetical protein